RPAFLGVEAFSLGFKLLAFFQYTSTRFSCQTNCSGIPSVAMNLLKDAIGNCTLPLASGWPWALHPVNHDESRKPLYCGYS
ncbi:MAG: hypothetical protein ABSC55_26305, partial [Syntrophorhabdales bacterium]